jgi:hypothetical protein
MNLGIALSILILAAPGLARATESGESGDSSKLETILESDITPGLSDDGVLPQEQQGPANAGRKRKSAKGGRARDANKETDGTQARDRFEANTAVKSKYESGGQPLEVDTD